MGTRYQASPQEPARVRENSETTQARKRICTHLIHGGDMRQDDCLSA
jgi:hypothetical protein